MSLEEEKTTRRVILNPPEIGGCFYNRTSKLDSRKWSEDDQKWYEDHINEEYTVTTSENRDIERDMESFGFRWWDFANGRRIGSDWGMFPEPWLIFLD